jgi:hypothetical protein
MSKEVYLIGCHVENEEQSNLLIKDTKVWWNA